MQKHELLLRIRYQTRSGEPLLSALAVEKALLAFYGHTLGAAECEITYQNDPYSPEPSEVDILS